MVQSYRNKNDLQDSLDVHSRTFYEYYRLNRKNTSKSLRNHQIWAACVSVILKSIGKLLVEKAGGVIINGFGYFGYVMMPKKIRSGFIDKAKFIYRPFFFGFGNFSKWTFEHSFIFDIKNPYRVNQVKKRELHYTLFNNLKIKI